MSVMRGVILAVVMVGCAGPRAFQARDETTIREVLIAQQDAWNRGDIKGYMAGYARTPGLVFTSGGQVRRGWLKTYEAYKARYGESRDTMGRLDIDVIAVQALGADGAVVLGRWQLTDTPNAASGIFSVVFARGPNGWRIVHDHTSADPTT